MYETDLDAKTIDSEDLGNPNALRHVAHVQIQQELYRRVVKSEFCNSYIALTSLGVAVLEREITHTYGHEKNFGQRLALLIIGVVLCLFLVISLMITFSK